MNNEKKSKDKKLKAIIIILLLLLVGSVGYNFIQKQAFQEQSKHNLKAIDDLSADNEKVNQLFEDSKELTRKLEGDVAEQDQEIQSTLAKIQKIKAENDSLITSGMDKEELNRRLRANLNMVRKLNKQLESKVDELLLENKKLETINTELTENIDSVNTINKDLNQKVAKASELVPTQITINAYKARGTDGEKWKKTKLARRTNKLEVIFNILKNEIAKVGDKKILLKIISPAGKTIGTLNNKGAITEVESKGAITYAAAKSFKYSGEEQKVTLEYITNVRDLPEGSYLFELFIDGESAANRLFDLK